MENEAEKKLSNKMIYIIVIIIVVTLLVTTNLFEIGRVSGISMKPTLYNNDMIIKMHYPNIFINKPKRNSVITFRAPHNSKYSFGKRVVGLPGDEILIESGIVYLNGEVLDEYYIDETTMTHTERYTEWVVPEEHVFVLGDNRQIGGSSDSRSYGFIPQSDITGYVIFVISPDSERRGFIK